MGVAGIFLDEAGYDFAVVTRERQNLAVRMIHELGLSAFMNAYFLEHLFSLDNQLPNANGSDKNPKRLAPLLDQRDLFLLESFEVKEGTLRKYCSGAEALEPGARVPSKPRNAHFRDDNDNRAAALQRRKVQLCLVDRQGLRPGWF